MADAVFASWYNNAYTVLKTTLSNNGITLSNITKRTVTKDNKLQATEMAQLVSDINTSKTNAYLKHAVSDISNLVSPTSGTSVSSTYNTKTKIDAYLNEISQFCGKSSFSQVNAGGTSFTNFGDNSTFSGNNNFSGRDNFGNFVCSTTTFNAYFNSCSNCPTKGFNTDFSGFATSGQSACGDRSCDTCSDCGKANTNTNFTQSAGFSVMSDGSFKAP